MKEAYLGLGSNIGDRTVELKEAIRLLNLNDNIKVVASSPIYETKPVGYTEQPDFLNQCVKIETDLSPHALLEVALDIEQQRHRVRKFQNGPRTLDVDILLYSDEIIETEDLSVPHKRMTERAFVMIPLNDIAPHLVEPRSQQTIETLVEPDETVIKYEERRHS
ncbi:2-amino-4-hydroxy-6-hydroxymethyldihydropteridine diphosphokinase [Staphylococcus massiliensis]|uniref:2-amino-4-hydroxy-6-hydroxymethyldihydropteridine diphosphokinase n=1 Tax=Staphylococcus massiliensis S46 TaxID=1229783 RepID=K9AUA0_9STAP|nr:2-amino-4-hydroxy-6-hydroxymethyldihydropteridine diphosphokinase [Staphylococcus massiliensis]EKU46172.1 2-amino-4-hydroxy-6-hydroxymethyldihydropteridine pyrophosphokinase [Staphylococcus massiliensis S46]MCG3400553.1 2-amino-4-hydroxy-6-hydroxymethyldihydropteridine diphosphokinase [Staphylococcus massiliensis]MCG3402789.1 2-amino-4-hydroxy-6-hydroxymethyldihydropteridine diphosphokinase [Staphylococcus massiliensis]POA01938.1 2-amino-4-hydroxy-6-hydroxymethyldihydropteridine diphosphokin